jgi:hypothetical protein
MGDSGLGSTALAAPCIPGGTGNVPAHVFMAEKASQCAIVLQARVRLHDRYRSDCVPAHP